MTNYEHMTDEEKKLAIIYGLHWTTEGDAKPCTLSECSRCPEYKTTCVKLLFSPERKSYLDREYIKHKTENEKFCETLRTGEIIVVWNEGKLPVLRTFIFYDKKTDSIQCVNNGHLIFSNEDELGRFSHGRKLTAEEKGE